MNMTYPRYEKDNLPHPFAYSVDLPRVLLTGFQPFNGNRENVSEEVVRGFSQSAVSYTHLTLPTIYSV